MYKNKRKLFTVLAGIIFLGVVGFLSFHQISKRQNVFLGTDLCTSVSERDKLPEGALPPSPSYSIEVHEVSRTESISSDSGEIHSQDGADFILVKATLTSETSGKPISIDVGDVELKNVEYEKKCGVYDLGDREPLGFEEDIASGVIEVKEDAEERVIFVFEAPNEFEPGSIGFDWMNFTLEPWN